MVVDLAGQRFNNLLVLERADVPDKYGRTFWRCLCSCGKECVVCTSHLRSGNTKSCGHRYFTPNRIYTLPDRNNMVGVCLIDNGRDYFWFDAVDADFVSQYQWHVAGRYVKAIVDGVHSLLSRCLLNIANSDPTMVFADHINGDTRDNRRCNLRIATAAENCANRGYAVGFNKTASGRYQARIRANRKFVNCGLYDTPEEAAQAAQRKRIEYFGEYAPVKRVVYFPGYDNDSILNPKNLLNWVNFLHDRAA